ncbi:MAG TPA: hypothetical protein ENH62_03105 [Marinobacter sp.]|uniref:Uncharacterized protein n=1 Tax=marine sediment metagenome TaxID=412755 RepID=A0A0F9QRP4_9ZZZZ|nr:hypothetical protein [Marinobacter sp.]
MAEFTELPIAAGPLVPRDIYNELLNAINNRRALVLPDATAAFTIYNSAGDATSATVEIDTAADEIYLIVVDGADASNTTLDLTAAANDTITELVAVINGLGFSWVAAEKSGAQSVVAGNKSDTLLSLGPADCLGASRITWFTNYAPNGVISEKLIGDIVAYRAAIDDLAQYFVRDGEVSSGAPPNRPRYYTINLLHFDAFGYNNVGWDSPGAPNLTTPCLPHQKLWNDMKACLDFLKWVAVDNDFGNTIDHSRAGTEFANSVSNANWNVARDNAIGGLGAGAPGNVGRLGIWADATIDEVPAPDEYVCPAKARTEWGITFQCDLGSIITMPSTPKGKLSIRVYQPSPSNPNPVRQYGAFSFDIYAEGNKVNSAPFVYAGLIFDRPNWLMDDLGDATLNMDGNDNLIIVSLLNTITDDPGVVEFPSPQLGVGDEHSRWIRGMRFDHSVADEARWWVILYFSWD